MLRSEVIEALQEQMKAYGDGEVIVNTRDNFGDTYDRELDVDDISVDTTVNYGQTVISVE